MSSTPNDSGIDTFEHGPRIDAYTRFIERYCRDDLGRLLAEYPKDSRTLNVCLSDLSRFSHGQDADGFDLSVDFVRNPEREREFMREALKQVDTGVAVEFKDDVNVRVHVPETYAEPRGVGQTRADEIGRYVSLTGQVTKRTQVLPQLTEAHFECLRCGTPNVIPQYEHGEKLQEPHECVGCERNGPFRLDEMGSTYADYQRIRLQRPPGEAGGESTHMDAVLDDDAVDAVRPGDRVTLSGVLRADPVEKGSRLNVPRLEAHAVDVADTDFEEIDIAPYRDAIEEIASGERGDPFSLLVDSIAPSIYGSTAAKLALALQLFGGSAATLEDGTHVRGDIHLCLIGDPGSGKSELLKSVSKIAPRSAFVSGSGVSAAGMTAAVVPDDFGGGGWTLEAGALVRASGGIACVDEIDKVPDETLKSLHTALEQQEVHISKAGIDATLDARTALAAAGNPVYGRFDKHEPLGEQVDIEPALLSRFDLLFLVRDKPDPVRDAEIAEHVIRTRASAIGYSNGEVAVEDVAVRSALDRATLRAYVAHARRSVEPRVEDGSAASERIRERYLELRQANGADDDSPVPVTARALGGLTRLAEASARVRLDDTVRDEDIDRAFALYERFLSDFGVDPESGEFDADIVEVGESKSQHERYRIVKGVIAELNDPHGDGAAHDDVVKRCEKALGIDRDRVEHAIAKLRERGDIYDPNDNGSYRPV